MGLSSAHHEACFSETVLFKLKKKKLFFQQHRHFLLLPKSLHLFPVICSFGYYLKYTSNNIDVSSVQSA